jgi:hypothetical protein
MIAFKHGEILTYLVAYLYPDLGAQNIAISLHCFVEMGSLSGQSDGSDRWILSSCEGGVQIKSQCL